uniref:Uncharacterized protein n=1 Tax=Arundo donax TaxID=35708 RepID=A0A0A9CUK1_ARUDO
MKVHITLHMYSNGNRILFVMRPDVFYVHTCLRPLPLQPVLPPTSTNMGVSMATSSMYRVHCAFCSSIRY